MPDASFGAAFAAGLFSFVSPCVLPLVPAYLAFLAGVSFEELKDGHHTAEATRKVVLASLAFVLGFSTIFIALGATASVVGQAIAHYFDELAIVAGLIIVILGLHFVGFFRIGWLSREARFHVARKPAGILGAYVVGLAFAFGWTPCVGPVLAAILFIAGVEGTGVRGATLLAVYSAGIGVPFLLAALFSGRFIVWASGFRKQMRRVELTMGGVLIVTGVMFMTGQMPTISNWLLQTFPVFAKIG
jgi:cytochrome c-type biogenesis protein